MDNDATSALRAAGERLFQFDPLLTMERLRQPVAAGGNGFGLFLRVWDGVDLPLIASAYNHGAPQRLHPSLSVVATESDRDRDHRRPLPIAGVGGAAATNRMPL
jgi:hypothetical protein